MRMSQQFNCESLYSVLNSSIHKLRKCCVHLASKRHVFKEWSVKFLYQIHFIERKVFCYLSKFCNAYGVNVGSNANILSHPTPFEEILKVYLTMRIPKVWTFITLLEDILDNDCNAEIHATVCEITKSFFYLVFSRDNIFLPSIKSDNNGKQFNSGLASIYLYRSKRFSNTVL